MGLVQFGGGVAQIRGKLGGTVFSRGRGGAIVRSWVSPINPNTAAQQQVRNALSTLVVKWLTVLTQLQRNGWKTYADNVPFQNALGDTIFLTGQQMFMRSNSVLVRNGLIRVDDAPTIFNLGDFTDPILLVGEISSPVINIVPNLTDAWATETRGFMFVQAARQMNPTINFFKGPFLQVGFIVGDPSPPPPPRPFFTPFTYTTGNRTFARFRVIRADGRLSSPSVIETTVA